MGLLLAHQLCTIARMLKPHLSAFALLVAFLCTGCRSNQKTPEIQAVERFVYAVHSGQTGVLFDGCTVESRASLARQLGLPPDAPKSQVIERLAVRPDWIFEKAVTAHPHLVSASAEDCVVEGSLGGRPWRFALQKEENEWRVDLLHSGERPAPADALTF